MLYLYSSKNVSMNSESLSQNSTTVFFDNNKNFFFFAVNQYIRMISEGSCDTLDWSNDAENSVLS